MMFYVISSVKGEESICWAGEDEGRAVDVAAELRKQLRLKDPDGARMDCYVISEQKYKRVQDAAEKWDLLSEKEKKETVEIDGKKFVKATIRERVRAARKRTGMSQAAFGAKYHIPTRTIENWESGERVPSVWALELLERVVDEDYPED